MTRLPAPAPEYQFRPQEGPQTMAAASTADIVIYGGAAGSGKTFYLFLESLRHHNVPGFNGLFVRRTSPQLTGSGSLFEMAQRYYPLFGGRVRGGQIMDCHFPAKALIEFKHFQHEKNEMDHRGKEYTLVLIDEITDFTPRMFWFLVSRNRSMAGVPGYIRATCNPDPDSFVRPLIDWWIRPDGYPIHERSGVVRWFLRFSTGEMVWSDNREELMQHPLREPDQDPMSFTFIAAKLDDNKALLAKDPAYRAKLMSLPMVERMRLLGGNWDVKPSSGLYFKQSYFNVVHAPPSPPVRTVRAWDKATSEVSDRNPDPDWTVGVKMSMCKNGEVYISNVVRFRGSPARVEASMLRTALLDGREVRQAAWQDPGQAGKADIANLVKGPFQGCKFTAKPATKAKEVYAAPLSTQAEHGNVYIQEAGWNDAFTLELEAFPDGGHDDQADAADLAYLILTSTRRRQTGIRASIRPIPPGAGRIGI